MVVLLLLLLCVGGCVYRVIDVVWFGPSIHIAPETTVVEGPLGPDGFLDYFAVINERMSAGVTPENNSAVLLVQALGPGAFDHVADDGELDDVEVRRAIHRGQPVSDIAMPRPRHLRLSTSDVIMLTVQESAETMTA